MGKPIDWTGQKYGKLTFLRPTDQRRFSMVIWEAQCECGTITQVVPKDGVSCGCFLVEVAKRTGKNSTNVGKVLYAPEIATARAIWGNKYQDDDLSFDDFYLLSRQPCDYCGRFPHRTRQLKKGQHGTFTYNGLDRIDSTKGHTISNVVPCCWDCNYMKGNRTREEFLLHIDRIHSHHVAKANRASSSDNIMSVPTSKYA
jgi:hypothetical protein